MHLQPVPRLNEIKYAEVRRIREKPVQVLRRFALSRSPIYGRGASGKISHRGRTGPNGISDHLSGYDEFDAAILLPARRRVVGSDWLRLAKPVRRHGRRGNAFLAEVVSHRTGTIFGKCLIVSVAAYAIGVALDGKRQRGVGEDDAGNLGQFLARGRAKREFGRIEKDVRHIDDEAASGISRLQDGVELHQQAGAKFFTVTHGLLKLLIRVRGGEAASCRFGLRVSLVLLGIRGGLIGVSSGKAVPCRFRLRVFLVLLGIRSGLIGVSSGGAIPVGIRLGIQFLLLCGGVVPFGLRLAGGGVAS